jgi:hypothetical protein
VVLMNATDLPAACGGFKNYSGHYTPAHASLGGHMLKTCQSRRFVGHKKHTLRLWLPTVHPSVTLVLLVSWLTPGNGAKAVGCDRVCIGVVVISYSYHEFLFLLVMLSSEFNN